MAEQCSCSLRALVRPPLSRCVGPEARENLPASFALMSM